MPGHLVALVMSVLMIVSDHGIAGRSQGPDDLPYGFVASLKLMLLQL